MGQKSKSQLEVPNLSSGELVVGHVNGVFGVRGEVRFFLENPDTDILFSWCEVCFVTKAGKRKSMCVKARAGSGRRIIGTIKGFTSREQAEGVVGDSIVLQESLLPLLEEGVWYHKDLLGLKVEESSGALLGVLKEIYPGGGVESWVVRDGDQECYIPLLDETVLSVNLERGVITVANGSGQVIE